MMRPVRLISLFLSLLVICLAACDAVPTKTSVTVAGDQMAVVYAQNTGALESILSPGSYDIDPIRQQVVFYPVFLQVYTFSDTQKFNNGALGGEAIDALAIDETPVRVSLSVVFRINAPEINVIFDSWGADDYRTGYIRPTARRVVQDIINDYTPEDLSTMPTSDLQQAVETALRAEYEANGFFLARVDLVSIDIAAR